MREPVCPSATALIVSDYEIRQSFVVKRVVEDKFDPKVGRRLLTTVAPRLPGIELRSNLEHCGEGIASREQVDLWGQN